MSLTKFNYEDGDHTAHSDLRRRARCADIMTPEFFDSMQKEFGDHQCNRKLVSKLYGVLRHCSPVPAKMFYVGGEWWTLLGQLSSSWVSFTW